MTQRGLERLAQWAASDAHFSAGSAAHKIAEANRTPDESESPVRHGVDIAELLRRLEADAAWSVEDGSTHLD